jgi:hypothetical protein
LPSNTQAKNLVREWRTPGSVRGVPGNRHPYRDQYFSGRDYYTPEQPCDATQIGRFRTAIGEAGVEELLKATIDTAVQTKAVRAAEFERIIVDTTVQEKPLPIRLTAACSTSPAPRSCRQPGGPASP